MRETLLKQATKLKRKNNQHKRWQKAVTALACMVVFCTVYALVLPAITMEKTPYCGKEEHTHLGTCYQEQLICGLEEGAGLHKHGEGCYTPQQVLSCEIAESEGHEHGEGCYADTTDTIFICQDTSEEHEHGEECYTTTTVTANTLSCGIADGEGEHHHSVENGCYETESVLTCEIEESEGHKHGEKCKENVLICDIQEHTHSLACYSDPSADVEDASVWNRTVSSAALSGNWGEDLAAVASTQTGYTESENNYEVMEDGTTMNGYTRYGAWAGEAYRDNWSAQFVNFCLSYAGIPSSAIAQKNDCGQWSITTTDADGNAYLPNTGDLIILDTDGDGVADHAGVVTKASDDGVKAVVGDLDKAVKSNTYSTGDSSIVGYVAMPENPALKNDSEDNADDENNENNENDENIENNENNENDENDGENADEDVTPTETPTPMPEVTEVPEATPTPTEIPEVTEAPEATPTPTEAPEITLVEDTLTVKVYSDSSYETELTDTITITVSGKLPENASVKAYPVENVTVNGEETLYAWDISIYDEQGNL